MNHPNVQVPPTNFDNYYQHYEPFIYERIAKEYDQSVDIANLAYR